MIFLHIGTTWLSTKDEWSLYLRLVNERINLDEYNAALAELNPPPAVGPAIEFRDQYQKVIEHIRSSNREAIILVSSIIPRPWDHPRRDLVRMSYNRLLQQFTKGDLFYKIFQTFFWPIQDP